MNFLQWLEGTSVGLWVSSSIWGYPIVLSLHAIGMAVVVGVSLMISLRGLGFASGIPAGALSRYLLVARVGFLVNLVSGTLLFMGSATTHWENIFFLIKIALVFIGIVLTDFLARSLVTSPDGEILRVRVLAVASAAVWISAIIAGRLIGYVT